MTLTVSALVSERKTGKFNVFDALLDSLNKNKMKLKEGDVLVISTKYISNSQDRIVNIDKVKFSKESNDVSKKFQMFSVLAWERCPPDPPVFSWAGKVPPERPSLAFDRGSHTGSPRSNAFLSS